MHLAITPPQDGSVTIYKWQWWRSVAGFPRDSEDGEPGVLTMTCFNISVPGSIGERLQDKLFKIGAYSCSGSGGDKYVYLQHKHVFTTF